MNKNTIVYNDETYTLGFENDVPYFGLKGKKYVLSCYPYEPCLYIKDNEKIVTTIHNSFDPVFALESFKEGRNIVSITGFEYTEKNFCKMLEYSMKTYDIQIDEAEKVFPPKKSINQNNKEKHKEQSLPSFNQSNVICDDPFFDLIKEYPDIEVDYVIVLNDYKEAKGYNSHFSALVNACSKLFIDDDGSVIYHYNIKKANAHQIDAKELFAPIIIDGEMNYRKAFLMPPYTNSYNDEDFDKVNLALFPNGTNNLEIYSWSTDFSEYFDEGHEWWGTLCLTIYDEKLDRFVIIMASATD